MEMKLWRRNSSWTEYRWEDTIAVNLTEARWDCGRDLHLYGLGEGLELGSNAIKADRLSAAAIAEEWFCSTDRQTDTHTHPYKCRCMSLLMRVCYHSSTSTSNFQLRLRTSVWFSLSRCQQNMHVQFLSSESVSVLETN